MGLTVLLETTIRGRYAVLSRSVNINLICVWPIWLSQSFSELARRCIWQRPTAKSVSWTFCWARSPNPQASRGYLGFKPELWWASQKSINVNRLESQGAEVNPVDRMGGTPAEVSDVQPLFFLPMIPVKASKPELPSLLIYSWWYHVGRGALW